MRSKVKQSLWTRDQGLAQVKKTTKMKNPPEIINMLRDIAIIELLYSIKLQQIFPSSNNRL